MSGTRAGGRGQAARSLVLLLGVALLLTGCAGEGPVVAPDLAQIPGLTATSDPQEVATGVQVMLLLTVLSLAPAILILTTSFTRIVIVLSFVRNAVGTQQIPPNQVLIGLALFLTLFSMSPTLEAMNNEAFQPYLKGEMGQPEAVAAAQLPLKDFMLRQTREKDIALFVQLSAAERPRTPQEVSLTVLIPAFAISELKTAF